MPIFSSSRYEGVTLAALGLETPTGDFEVQEVIYPGFAPIMPLPNSTPNEGEHFHLRTQHKPNARQVSYCAFLSGISFGEWPGNLSETSTIGKARKPDTGTILSLFVEWISGEGGSDHVSERYIPELHLIVCRIENLHSA